MKLNNQQINALASKFFNELQLLNFEKNKKAREVEIENYRKIYDKAFSLFKENKFLESICIIITNKVSIAMSRNTSFQKFTENYKFSALLKSKTTLKTTVDDIKNDIILATIDTSSIDEIMEVLTKKYK